MSGNENEGTGSQQTGLHNLERNRYFFGKLIGPREMRMEQDYFTGRSNMHSQFVSGSGIVCGLELTNPTQTVQEDASERLEVTLKSGVAVDGYGRQIVVENEDPKPIRRKGDDKNKPPRLPDGTEVNVFLTYVERSEEPVPVPGKETATGKDPEEFNKQIEEFDLYYTEPENASDLGLTRSKESVDVNFPRVPDLSYHKADQRLLAYRSELNSIAHSYHQKTERDCDSPDDASLFLGVLKKEGDKWEVKTDEAKDPLPYTYSNDMLYTGLSRLALRADPLENHLLKTTISDSRNTFNELADTFPNGSQQAKDIAKEADEVLKGMYPAKPRQDGEQLMVKEAGEQLIAFLGEVFGSNNNNVNSYTQWMDKINIPDSDSADKDRFLAVVKELGSAFHSRDRGGQSEQTLYLATLQDGVNEAARWLQSS